MTLSIIKIKKSVRATFYIENGTLGNAANITKQKVTDINGNRNGMLK